jgi:hypothetical protein
LQKAVEYSHFDNADSIAAGLSPLKPEQHGNIFGH